MSKGLDYLASQRPEAMAGLLKFYGKSVKALDDKTRLLISIVTKVITGTERGLRQYAPQAYKAGASKEEILDAVLMAFPAAGLTKVVDAVHILLAMDLLPAAETNAAEPASSECVLGKIGDFPTGEMRSVQTEHGSVLVYRGEDGNVQVYSAVCPHAKGDLNQGKCSGSAVECPVHHWTFNLETGENVNPKRTGLVHIPTELRNGCIIALFSTSSSVS